MKTKREVVLVHAEHDRASSKLYFYQFSCQQNITSGSEELHKTKMKEPILLWHRKGEGVFGRRSRLRRQVGQALWTETQCVSSSSGLFSISCTCPAWPAAFCGLTGNSLKLMHIAAIISMSVVLIDPSIHNKETCHNLVLR